jgi:hypothetical protein
MNYPLEQLRECVGEVLTEYLGGIEQRLRVAADPTAPLTAEMLCVRWNIVAETQELRLVYLSRRCAAWGLKPMLNTSGFGALYNYAQVLAAEEYAQIVGSGKTKRKPKPRRIAA